MTSAFHDSQLEGGLREGWTEAVLEELVIHALGGDWGVSCEPSLPAGYVRVSVLRGTEFKRWDQEKGRTAAERAVKQDSFDKRALRVGDLVVEISGGGPGQPVGRSLLIDEAAIRNAKNPLVCSNFCRQVRLHAGVDPAYVALVLRHRYERGDINDCQSQTTNLRNLNFGEFLAGVTVPLPPLAEQRRIVAQAEELLVQARQARSRLAQLPALRRFRQSVLAHAFSGYLTESWRACHSDRESPRFSDATEWQVPEPLEVPEIPESWTLVALGDLITRAQYGMSVKAEGDAASGVPILRMPNIQDGQLDLSDLKYVKRDTKGLERFRVQRGDILLNRSNSSGLVGKSAVVDVDREMVFASYLVRLTCDEQRVSSRFVCAWINSPWGRRWAHTVRTDSVGQSNINSSKLRCMPVPTPPLAEQLAIVRRMEGLFRIADAAEAQVATATAEADRLAQSVLDQALRGELVPTEAELARREGRSYEPGWVLLGRVKAERGPLRTRRGRKAGRPPASAGRSRRDARRSRPVAVYDPDQVLIAFRQLCWGAGAVSEDELIRRVAERLGVARLGKKIRARLLDHLGIAIERRIVARRGDVLEGATPTFARYDDEFLLQVLRSVLRSGVGYEEAAAVRLVASYLGYGQVTAALRGRMETLFRTGMRRGLLVVGEGKVWRRE